MEVRRNAFNLQKLGADDVTMVCKEYKSFILELWVKSKENVLSKQLQEVLQQLEKKYSDRIKVSCQANQLSQEHLLPVLCVREKQQKTLVMQIFNIADLLGGKNGITLANLERFLIIRGVIDSTLQQQNFQFESRKEQETHMFVCKSHFMQENRALDDNALEELNKRMLDIETIQKIELDQTAIKKDKLVDVYRQIADPFGREIAELDYLENPADPTKLIKTVEFSKLTHLDY